MEPQQPQDNHLSLSMESEDSTSATATPNTTPKPTETPPFHVTAEDTFPNQDTSTEATIDNVNADEDSELGSKCGNTSRELKSLLALSKEAKLDTNISHKRKSVDLFKVAKTDNSKEVEGETKKSKGVEKGIKFPVTAESELDEILSKQLAESPEKAVGKLSQKERPVGGSSEERKLSKFIDVPMFKPNKDKFCWRCHREAVNVACETCPRSYHQKCLKQTISDEDHWPCPECVAILRAESTQTRSETMKGMTLEHLCGLLKFAVKRMIDCTGSEPFLQPVSEKDFPEYKKYIVQPMDLSMLEKNIKNNLYGSPQAFEADAKWILHNSIIFNSYQSKLTQAAKTILKICKQEMSEIENCPSCYLNANQKKSTWFVEVCPKPHILVWAKLKGFPYWPAKVMCANSAGMVDVRFFGQHDRAWVPFRECFLYSRKDPNSKKRNDVIECIKEVDVYIKNLKAIYGEFNFAPFKIQYDPDIEAKQMQLFLPRYKPNARPPQYRNITKKSETETTERTDNEASTSSRKEEFETAMEGYGTEDDEAEGEKLENECDDDDTQVSSNVDAEEVVKTSRVSSGKAKAVPRMINRKRSSVDSSDSPRKLSRRDSDRSDSSRKSSISDKINKVDISENMEISLGNDNEGFLNISETVSSSTSETSDFEIDARGKAIQVNVNSGEVSISPQNKIKITDRIMRKLSDDDNREKVKRQISNEPHVPTGTIVNRRTVLVTNKTEADTSCSKDSNQALKSPAKLRVIQLEEEIVAVNPCQSPDESPRNHQSPTPNRSVETPSHGIEAPSRSIGTPSRSIGTPSRSIRTPSQSIRTPSRSIGTPSRSIGTPSRSIGTPSQSIATPCQSIGTPCQSIGTPSRSIGTTNQSIEMTNPSIETSADKDLNSSKLESQPKSPRGSDEVLKLTLELEGQESRLRKSKAALKMFDFGCQLAKGGVDTKGESPKFGLKRCQSDSSSSSNESDSEKSSEDSADNSEIVPKKLKMVLEQKQPPIKGDVINALETSSVIEASETSSCVPKAPEKPKTSNQFSARSKKSEFFEIVDLEKADDSSLVETKTNKEFATREPSDKEMEKSNLLKSTKAPDGNSKNSNEKIKDVNTFGDKLANSKSVVELSGTVLVECSTNLKKQSPNLKEQSPNLKEQSLNSKKQPPNSNEESIKFDKSAVLVTTEPNELSKEPTTCNRSSPETMNNLDQITSKLNLSSSQEPEVENPTNVDLSNAKEPSNLSESREILNKAPKSNQEISPDELNDSNHKRSDDLENLVQTVKAKVEVDILKPRIKPTLETPQESTSTAKSFNSGSEKKRTLILLSEVEDKSQNQIRKQGKEGEIEETKKRKSSDCDDRAIKLLKIVPKPSLLQMQKYAMKTYSTNKHESQLRKEVGSKSNDGGQSNTPPGEIVEIKSEPNSEDDAVNENEYMEKKKEYLSALNISEKSNEVAPSKPHIRTRSKTEDKRFRVTDNLSRVIDDVASGQAKKPSEITVKSFAKMQEAPFKQKARKSFPTPYYNKALAVAKKPALSTNLPEKVTATQNVVPKVTTAASKVTTTVATSTLTITTMSTSQVQTTTTTVSTPQVQTTTTQALDPVTPSTGYVILTQNPGMMNGIGILPSTHQLAYDSATNSFVTLLPPLAQFKKTMINVSRSQNYIPQSEIPASPPVACDLSTDSPSLSQQTSATAREISTPSKEIVPPVDRTLTPIGTVPVSNTSTPSTSVVDVRAETSQDDDEFSVLNNLLPESVSKAMSELLCRPPPKLKPRPPGPLSTTFDSGPSSSAGAVSSRINSIAHRLGDYFRGMLIELLEDLGKSNNSEATIASLQLELETVKDSHKVEMMEIKKNICTILKDIQRSILEEKDRVIEETRAACELETIKRVEEAKSKQWCANCSKEAQFYCCWNTSYCDYPCQQKHWPKHMNKCTQNSIQSSPVLRPQPQSVLVRTTAPKGFSGRILTKPTKVFLNKANGKPGATFKTTAGNHVTLVNASSLEFIGNGKIVTTGGFIGRVKAGAAVTVTSPSTSSSNSNLNPKLNALNLKPVSTTSRAVFSDNDENDNSD